MEHNEEEFWNEMPDVWVAVTLRLPANQAHYDSPMVHEMERWCVNNCKTYFFTVICDSNLITVRFMCVKSNSCDQATIDAAAFKLRWI